MLALGHFSEFLLPNQQYLESAKDSVELMRANQSKKTSQLFFLVLLEGTLIVLMNHLIGFVALQNSEE
jgi:hypothetical protein